MASTLTWLVVLPLCINGLLPVAHAAGPLGPQAVNLRLADMPAGFKQTREAVRDNDTAAALDPSTSAPALHDAGQQLENEVKFRRTGAHTGLLAVDSTVVLFTSERAALARFTRSNADTHRYAQQQRLAALQPLPMDPVGMQHAAWVNHPSKGDIRTQVIVEFYRKQFDVTVEIDERTPQMATLQLLRFARLVDSRIQRGH